MTDRTDEDYDYEPEQPRRGRALSTIVVIALLAGAGVGSAFIWRAYGGSFQAIPSIASKAESAAPADKPVGQTDFQAFRQQIAASVQSTEQLLAAQQAEIKRLSDQVAALSAKLDAVQKPAAPAQAAVPAAVAKPVTAPPRKPAAPKPTGSISVGGAPLPPPVR